MIWFHSSAGHAIARDRGWHEIKSGTWQRPLDAMEKWVYTNATATQASLGREDNIINIFARLNIPFARYGGKSAFIERLREGWKALRLMQPMLASRAVGGNRECELWRGDSSDAAEWLHNSVTILDDVSRLIDAHSLYGELGPVNQANLYFSPTTQDLIIRCPHYLIDGIGHLMLHHHLLSLITTERSLKSAQSTQPSPEMLSPPMGIAAALPPPTDHQLRKNRDQLSKFTSGQYLPIGPAMSITDSGQTRKLFKRFSPSQTATLLQASKRRGYTITHACHAAAILASAKHGDPTQPPRTKYLSGTAFDMRNRSIPPYNSNTHPCTVYLLPRFLMLESGDYDSTVHQIASSYRNARDDPDLSGTIIPFLTEMDAISQAMVAMQPPPPPIAAVGLSSLGKIETHLQREYGDGEERIGVEEVSIAGEFLTPSVALHIWTFRDRLTVQMEWNSRFFDGGLMAAFFETVLNGVWEGVGVTGTVIGGKEDTI
ncbi:MAG: hypothetical protein L6R40_007627 [Gallowayella cf. fulva]|nr:MAG: hypothetical protein L6R40_007627 [Xanthomendoza cf. fulva]